MDRKHTHEENIFMGNVMLNLSPFFDSLFNHEFRFTLHYYIENDSDDDDDDCFDGSLL